MGGTVLNHRAAREVSQTSHPGDSERAGTPMGSTVDLFALMLMYVGVVFTIVTKTSI